MLLSQLEVVEETLRFVYNLVYNNFNGVFNFCFELFCNWSSTLAIVYSIYK